MQFCRKIYSTKGEIISKRKGDVNVKKQQGEAGSEQGEKMWRKKQRAV